MISNMFLYMMIAHLLGDYYLQNESLADGKRTSFRKLLLHLLVYSITGAVFAILVFNVNVIWYFGAFIISHIAIDLAKYFVPKKHKDKPWVYITDQTLHILSIIIIAALAIDQGVSISFLTPLKNLFTHSQIAITDFLKVTLLLLIVLKPVNITFKKIFNPANAKTQSKNKTLEVSDDKALSEQDKEKEVSLGAIIGSMERLLIVILLLLNQYTAIGLVLTGKSVARYNKVSAEYYIVGTFFSLLCALIPYLIIMHLF